MTYFGQQARSYAFTILCAAVATWLLLRALDRPGWRRWAGYAAAIGLTATFHLVAAAIVAGHAVAVLVWYLIDRDRRYLWWLAAAPAGLLLALPVALPGLGQRDEQVFWLTKPGLRELLTVAPFVFMSAAVAVAMLVIAVLGVGTHAKATALGSGLALVPVAAVWVLSQSGSSYWFSRYLGFTLIGAVLLAAGALDRMRAAHAIAIVAVVALVGVQDHRLLRRPDGHDPAHPESSVSRGGVLYSVGIRALAPQVRPGDARLYIHSDSWTAMETALAYHGLGEDRLKTLCLAQTGRQRQHLWGSPAKDVPGCLGDARRVWVLRPYDQRADPLAQGDPALIGTLQATYQRVSLDIAGSMTMALYERR